MGSTDVYQKELFPEGGCDSHHHIFEPATYPYSPDRHLTPPEASCEAYQCFQKSLGITKSVLTHGLSYGDDCSSLKAFITTLSSLKTRGCAVVTESTTDDEMAALSACGVRGIRLNLYGYGAMTDLEAQIRILKLYAARVQHQGWFVEFLQLKPSNWIGLEPVIATLPAQVVTDHHALLKAESMLPPGVNVLSQPGLADIVSLLRRGNFWVKLSAPYRCSTQAPYYEDMKPIVLALVEANPNRVLWGSDWPHTPNMKVRTREEATKETPFQDVDDRAWLMSLRSWLTDEQWRLLMITNPDELYFQ